MSGRQKVAMYLLILLFITSLTPSTLYPDEGDWSYKTWSVLQLIEIKSLLYKSHGNNTYGNVFGFLKRPLNCDNDTLLVWLTAYTFDLEGYKALRAFRGGTANLQFRVGDVKFQGLTEISLVESPVLPIVVVGFSNVTPNEDLIFLLREAGKKGKAIEVTIVGPEELVKKFDEPSDTFNLEGFSKARQKARELCEAYKSLF